MPDLTDIQWLVRDDGVQWLDRAAALDPQTLALGGLRRELGAERARLVAEQVNLRRRAREKFPEADRMFFTRQGLEQATDAWIAAYKAGRFPPDARVVDLCTGIGGDLQAMARTRQARGCDLDPVVAVFAAANAGAPVDVCDAAAFDWQDATAWHIDPDRRPEGKRTTRIESFQPDLGAIESLLNLHPHAAVKLAPATTSPAGWHERCELEWVSRAGECRQQIAWHGELARRAGRKAATMIQDGVVRQVVQEVAGEPSDATVASAVGRFVFEPDPAVLAAGLTDDLAHEHGLERLTAGVAYLTGDRPIADPALDAFEVSDLLPLDRKRLAALFAERGVGRLEIKKRGCDIDPELLRKQLRLKGDHQATLVIAPFEGRVMALVCRRT